MNYLIGDFLIRIKNAYSARKKAMTFPYSRTVFSIGNILKEEGYIKDIRQKSEGNRKYLELELLYKNKKPLIQNVKIVSKPSVHIYVNANNIPRTKGGFGLTIISTSKGIVTDKQARKIRVGGEVLGQIF